jgi:hypothetical protein
MSPQGLRAIVLGPCPLLQTFPSGNVMDDSRWYAVAIAAIAASFLCVCMIGIFTCCINRFVVHHFLKYLYYRRISTRVRGTTTWFCTLLIIAFLAGNIIYLSFKREELLKQTGILSTINLIPLALGGHMNLVVDMCGLASEEYNQMHHWIALVAAIEALLHSVLALTSQPPDLRSLAHGAAIAVRRRRFY